MAKIPVVLLPALLCDATLFLNQVHHLQSDADFFIPDAGTADNVVDRAAEILEKAPSRFALGYIAFEIMRQAPERVLSLLLMDTTAAPDAPEKSEKRRKLIELAEKNGIESVVPFVLTSVVAPEYAQLPQLQRFFTFMAQSVGTQAFKRAQNIISGRPDSRPFLQNIDAPCVVIGGGKDAVTPPDSLKALANAIPNARHTVIENSGHLPPLENPDAVTAVMKSWLNDAALAE